MKKLPTLCLIFLFFCVSIHAQNTAISKKVDALFSTLTNETPGAAVIVVQNGKVVLERNYGLANLEHQIPITSKTVFDIASISKQFCGMAIALLIEDGKIKYEDDVRKYIPELPDFGHTITIGHLLHHTSGIRDWTNSMALAGWSFDDVISMDQILNMAYNQQGLNFEPGAEYLYSNTGYNLLAEVVHRISGQSFRKWTDEHIFKPLRMTQTHFHDDHTEVVPHAASSYRRQDNSFHLSVNSLTALGSSSLFTTTNDLAKWVINFDQPKVGGKKVIDRMMQTKALNDGKPNNYAYGLVTGKYKGLDRIRHGGSWAGFRTSLHHFPEQRFSVVVLLNAPIMNPNQAAENIVDIYLKDLLEEEPKKEKTDVANLKFVEVATATLDEYLGTYKLGSGWYVTITRENKNLITTATNEPSFPMKATSETNFLVPAYGNRFINFKRDDNGQVKHFEYNGMTCPKMKGSPTQITKDLEGQYRSDELFTIYTLKIKDGKLTAHHPHNGAIPIKPMWEGEFTGGRFFMGIIHFERDSKGNVTGMRITSGRSRNQIFHKM